MANPLRFLDRINPRDAGHSIIIRHPKKRVVSPFFVVSLPNQGLDRAQREQLAKRLRQANTTRLYKQNRFNLLHEESEGYSKVRRFVDG